MFGFILTFLCCKATIDQCLGIGYPIGLFTAVLWCLWISEFARQDSMSGGKIPSKRQIQSQGKRRVWLEVTLTVLMRTMGVVSCCQEMSCSIVKWKRSLKCVWSGINHMLLGQIVDESHSSGSRPCTPRACRFSFQAIPPSTAEEEIIRISESAAGFWRKMVRYVLESLREKTVSY